MKVDLDIVSPVQRKIRVELPADEVGREFATVYESLGQSVRIRGFRPGKAPRSVLQGLYGDEAKGRVLSRLVERSLGEVFKERGLKPVSRPEVEADGLEEGKAFTFSALVEVKPEIHVQNYLGQELEKVKLSLDESHVETGLRHLQESYAHLVPVEDRDVVQQGDFVVLDFVGSVGGKPLPGARSENYHLEIGSGRALQEFEEALVGLKKNGEHNIRVPFPEEHSNRNLAGKTVDFSVVIREIKKKVVPPLDDEFAKDHGECASLDELREKIRSRLETELQEAQTRELKEQLLSRLIDSHSIEIPPSMVEQQVRYLVERQQSRPGAGASSSSGERTSLEQMRKEVQPQALRQVKATLLVEKIAELEKIGVSDEELQQRIDLLARAAGEKGPALREIYRQPDACDDLRSQMIFDRTVDFLFQGSKLKDVDAPVDAGEKKS